MSKENKVDEAALVGLFKARRVIAEITLRELPQGYRYARIAFVVDQGPPLDGAGGQEADASPKSKATPKSLMQGDWISKMAASRSGIIDHGELSMSRDPDWSPAEDDLAELNGMVRRLPLTNIVHEMERFCSSMDSVRDRGAMIGWSARFQGELVDLNSWARAHERLDQLIYVGDFECSTGKIWASDPCYGQDARLGAHLDGAKGCWDAYSARKGMGSWGDRSSRLLIVPKGADPLSWLAGASPAALVEVGDSSVDSGQAGFFDSDAFIGSGNLDDAFYDACCAETLGGLRAGAIRKGAVSSSGDGDGGYPILAARGSSGELLAARIDFYQMEPQEELSWRARLAQGEAACIAALVPQGGGYLGAKKL